MSEVKLSFKNDVTNLAGYPYGESVYNNQVKNKINLNDNIVIVFPDNIKKVASSFVQGFFSDLVLKLGYNGVERNVKIITVSEELTKRIYDNLY